MSATEEVQADHQRIFDTLERRRTVTSRPGRRGWLMRRLLLLADGIGLLLAFVLTELLFGSSGYPDAVDLSDEVAFFALTLPAWVIGARLFGLYDRDEERADHTTSDDLVRVFLLATVGAFLVTRLTALTGKADPDPLKATTFWAATIGFVTIARALARSAGRRRPSYIQDTIVVGAGDVGQLIARKIVHHPEFGLRLTGFVDSWPRDRLSHIEQIPVLGDLDELPRIIDEQGVERVIFAFTSDRHEDYLPLIRRLRDSGVQVDMVPRLFEVIGPKIDVHSVEGISLVGLPPVKLARSTRATKRALDVVGAGAALILLAPLIALIAVAVRLDSPGPVFFRQRRLGQNMREFSILKFRTMRTDVDPEAHRAFIGAIMSTGAAPTENGMFKLDQASAVTSTGRFLRRWSLDELPQLVNVLRGDMSLVGPRPCLAYELEHFAPHHFERFLVPAGLTGLWQVSARARSTFVEALDMDVLYAQSYSLGLDLRLLARTPIQLLRSSTTA
jgi:exopolysaccharide biosynthesis polyprenyl glycosylphosphotransferase